MPGVFKQIEFRTFNVNNESSQWTTCAIAKHHGSLVTKQNFATWTGLICKTWTGLIL